MKTIIFTKYKKLISLFLTLIIVLSSNKIAFGVEIREESTLATVIKVIDGDTIQVALPSNKTAYVGLEGIKTTGYDESFSYLTNELLGRQVKLVKADNGYNGSRINYMIVYYNGVNMSRKLLELGLAEVDNSQNSTYLTNNFRQTQTTAKDNLNGMWKYNSDAYSSITNSFLDDYYTISDRININTATARQIDSYLYGVDRELAENIVEYRKYNPISSIDELKFIDGFTSDIYTRNKNRISLYTNINTATRFELYTLSDITYDEVDSILNERKYTSINDKRKLLDIISRSTYYDIEDFIFTENINHTDFSKNKYRANISVSDRDTLQDAGLSYSDSTFIINNRDSGYTYKTLSELTKIHNSPIRSSDIARLSDNLNTMININTGNRYILSSVIHSDYLDKVMDKYFYEKDDLASIIGTTAYNNIKNVLYLDKIDTEYININTATKSELTSTGLSEYSAERIISARPITSPYNIPINISSVDNKISLYTNINTATKTELLSLHKDITHTIADEIINYTKKYGSFGSLNEVYEFFNNYELKDVYYDIKDYIVLI